MAQDGASQRLRPCPAHTSADQVVPAIGLLHLALGHHDQPAPRPCHRHIQKPQPLRRLTRGPGRPFARNQGRAFVFRHFPDRLAARQTVKLIPVVRFAVASIRQDYDFRFQALGAVDRHHPDAGAFAVKLALHLDLIGSHPDQKTGQTGHL